ncbi:zinc-ribbon domain-containing protein, partial [Paracoccus siganidrum]
MDEIKLTCETCGAQYKLATSALPPAGREVQCTACGHTWLARPHAALPASA